MPYVFNLLFWQGTWIRHLPLPAGSQNWQITVCDDHTVMLLLEDIFAMSTLLNFEFYIHDLL